MVSGRTGYNGALEWSRFRRRASTFCKAPLKKSASSVLSANNRFSRPTSLRTSSSREFTGACSPSSTVPVDPPLVQQPAMNPKLFRQLHDVVAAPQPIRPPSAGAPLDIALFAALPLAAPFPAKCANCECLILGIQSTEANWLVGVVIELESALESRSISCRGVAQPGSAPALGADRPTPTSPTVTFAS
jgi:hypothetical protein